MASRRGSADKFTPIKGLITEGNKGQFPQDSALETLNVELLLDGTVRRRLGADREANGSTHFSVSATNRIAGAMSHFLWKDVNGIDGFDLRLVQTGNTITVFKDVAPLSQQPVLIQFLLGDVQRRAEYSVVGSYLVVTNGVSDPRIVEVNGTEDSPSTVVTSVDIEVRVDYRLSTSPPSSVGTSNQVPSVQEEFDLRNSGWPFDRNCAMREDGQDDPRWTDPAWYTWYRLGYWPGISLSPKFMILDSAEDPDSIGVFSPWQANEDSFFGNSVPALGHYITSAWSVNARQLMLADLKNPTPSAFREPFFTNRSETVKSTGNYIQSTANRPVCVGHINGHALFGGLDLDNKPTIWVSQLVKTKDSIGRCYQEADPTADEINDLIATDGGVLHPVGMGTPLAIREFGNGAVIFAQNGVWKLSGSGTGESFSMTSFSFNKITSIHTSGASSIVQVEGVLLYFSEEGIIQISSNQFGETEAQNLTKGTIQSYYNSFGDRAIQSASGMYSPTDKRVYWLIPDSREESQTYLYDASLLLILDTQLPGFFVYQFPIDDGSVLPRPVLPLELSSVLNQAAVLDVVTNSFCKVVTSTGDQVVADGTVQVDNKSSAITLLTMRKTSPTTLTFHAEYSQLTDLTFMDWAYISPTNFTSRIKFAYLYPSNKTAGMQVPYLHSFFAKEREVRDAPNAITNSITECDGAAPVVDTDAVIEIFFNQYKTTKIYDQALDAWYSGPGPYLYWTYEAATYIGFFTFGAGPELPGLNIGVATFKESFLVGQRLAVVGWLIPTNHYRSAFSLTEVVDPTQGDNNYKPAVTNANTIGSSGNTIKGTNPKGMAIVGAYLEPIKQETDSGAPINSENTPTQTLPPPAVPASFVAQYNNLSLEDPYSLPVDAEFLVLHIRHFLGESATGEDVRTALMATYSEVKITITDSLNDVYEITRPMSSVGITFTILDTPAAIGTVVRDGSRVEMKINVDNRLLARETTDAYLTGVPLKVEFIV